MHSFRRCLTNAHVDKRYFINIQIHTYRRAYKITSLPAIHIHCLSTRGVIAVKCHSRQSREADIFVHTYTYIHTKHTLATYIKVLKYFGLLFLGENFFFLQSLPQLLPQPLSLLLSLSLKQD